MYSPLFIIDVSNHMQQVAIIFLLYATAGPTIQLCFIQLLLSPEMSTMLGRRHFGTSEVLRTLCADTVPLILCLWLVAPLCLQCLFDVTSAERDRHH